MYYLVNKQKVIEENHIIFRKIIYKWLLFAIQVWLQEGTWIVVLQLQ